MKKRMAKTLAVLMCLMTAVAFMPTFAFAEEGAADEQQNQPAVSQEEPQADAQGEAVNEPESEQAVEPQGEGETQEVEPAADADVYFTVFEGGSLAKEKGEIVYKKKITVSDDNKDGELTYDEAAAALHEKYNKAADFEVASSGWVTKFWGFDGSSLMMMKNGKFPETLINETPVKKGDQLVAGEILDPEGNYWMNAVTAFNKTEAAAAVGQGFKLKLSYGNNFEYDKDFSEDPGTAATSDDQETIVFGIVTNDGFEEIDSSINDNGIVTLKINKEGTFLVSAMGYIGDAALPIGIAPVCTVTVTKNAPDADVTVTISNKGVLAAAKDGSVMVDRSVTVTDINADGKLTYDEALAAAHKRYCADGEEGFSAPSGWVSKLWGINGGNASFFKNGVATGLITEEAVEEGDALYSSVNSDDVYYADWFTAFDVQKKSVAVNSAFPLTLKGAQAMTYTPDAAVAVAGVKIGTWEDGKFQEISGKTTDSNGTVELTFNKPGTYYVTASGTVEDSVTDWGAYPPVTKTAQCPIAAPACKVTVYDDSSVELSEAKADAIKSLTESYDINNYRSIVHLTLLSQVVAGVAEINGADTPAKVDAALAKAIESISAIKTDAQMTADENAVKAIKVSSVSAKAGKKKATVKWKRNTTFSGYQIYYKQSGKSAKYTKASSTASSKVIKSLKKGKKYTIKVRGYKNMNGKTIYGAWSSSKTIRIK